MKTVDDLWLNELNTGILSKQLDRFEKCVDNLDGWGTIFQSGETLTGVFQDCIGTLDLNQFDIDTTRDEYTQFFVEYCQAILLNCGYGSLINVVNWSIPEETPRLWDIFVQELDRTYGPYCKTCLHIALENNDHVTCEVETDMYGAIECSKCHKSLLTVNAN